MDASAKEKLIDAGPVLAETTHYHSIGRAEQKAWIAAVHCSDDVHADRQTRCLENSRAVRQNDNAKRFSAVEEGNGAGWYSQN